MSTKTERKEMIAKLRKEIPENQLIFAMTMILEAKRAIETGVEFKDLREIVLADPHHLDKFLESLPMVLLEDIPKIVAANFSEMAKSKRPH
jgi:hypothetical protein